MPAPPCVDRGRAQRAGDVRRAGTRNVQVRQRGGIVARYLFTIIDTFTVKGYGIGLTPGLTLADYRLVRGGR